MAVAYELLLDLANLNAERKVPLTAPGRER
jgi:hypothetical protein